MTWSTGTLYKPGGEQWRTSLGAEVERSASITAAALRRLYKNEDVGVGIIRELKSQATLKNSRKKKRNFVLEMDKI
ncbi:hypothetical protein SAMD00023353_5800610 [Rosellinia necatrix]|uniref:Uncharacterized protein n=1 Tax=Rosellinia necatrix TaxID=77044 RepID=A0A1S8AA95_ROSNE|nr:hypothetical protein SAMD00023353_5800610 [Rosellinia necatrix]